jgi:TetR/AcrR family transcriptional repressor of nem operon
VQRYDDRHMVSRTILLVPAPSKIDCCYCSEYDERHEVLSTQLSLRLITAMPWPKEHKRQTRDRIIEVAAAAFRQDGICELGVAEIMERAGLTHGGFYAHFASKEDLLIEALRHASAESNEMLVTAAPAKGESGSPTLLDAALTYLSSFHLQHIEKGCPIAALGPELERSGQKVKRTFSTEINKRLEKLHDLTTGGAKKRRQQAAGALACMVGGLIVARALKESERAEFLKDCQAFLREALSPPAAGR